MEIDKQPKINYKDLEGLTAKLKFDVDRFEYLHENEQLQLFVELAENDILYFPLKSDFYFKRCCGYVSHYEDEFEGLYNITGNGPGYIFDLYHITEPRITFSAREELFGEATWHLDYKRRNFEIQMVDIEIDYRKQNFCYLKGIDPESTLFIITWDDVICGYNLKLLKETKRYNLQLMHTKKKIGGYVFELDSDFGYGLEEKLHSDEGAYDMKFNFYGKDYRNLVMTRGQNYFKWKANLEDDGEYYWKLKRINLLPTDKQELKKMKRDHDFVSDSDVEYSDEEYSRDDYSSDEEVKKTKKTKKRSRNYSGNNYKINDEDLKVIKKIESMN